MENKRDIWSYEETVTLISILKEKQILKIMDNKRFRITEIFKSLEGDMKKKGYCRSATQINIKFKALKKNYNNSRTTLLKSGAGWMKKCPFYDKLHELFGCRPINIQKGMNSLNATSIANMYDNIPDADGAIPECSTFSDEFNNNSYINNNENQIINSDENTISSNENNSINYSEENCNLTIIDKEEPQLDTLINTEIINNNDDIENNKNKDCKKKLNQQSVKHLLKYLMVVSKN